jgi:hypothetical protein
MGLLAAINKWDWWRSLGRGYVASRDNTVIARRLETLVMFFCFVIGLSLLLHHLFSFEVFLSLVIGLLVTFGITLGTLILRDMK